MDQMISMVHDVSPSLNVPGGYADEEFRRFEKLVTAEPDFENPFINGSTFAERWSLTAAASNNLCRLYLDRLDLATGAWGAAITANFAGEYASIVATGE